MVSLELNFTTRQTPHTLRLSAALCNKMIKIFIKGNSEEISKILFKRSKDSTKLYFGPSGLTLEECSIEELFNSRIEFSDYLMEAFVKFKMRAFSNDQGLLLEVYESGSNRDRYLASHIKHVIQGLGFEIEDA